jgi:hypothetical protein
MPHSPGKYIGGREHTKDYEEPHSPKKEAISSTRALLREDNGLSLTYLISHYAYPSVLEYPLVP